MVIDLHILHRDANVRALLLKDGWHLERETNGQMFARHDAVADESAARERLDRVGLLTSNKVQIRFQRVTPRRVGK